MSLGVVGSHIARRPTDELLRSACSSLALLLTTQALKLTPLKPEEEAKALYRRALAGFEMKNDEGAEADLTAAKALVPADAAIPHLLARVQARQQERKQRERSAFSKMFA